MAKYAGVDFIDFDSQLNDERKAGAPDGSLNSSKTKLFRSSKSIAARRPSRCTWFRNSANWIFWRQPARLRLRWNVQRGLRPDDARARTWRFRHPFQYVLGSFFYGAA